MWKDSIQGTLNFDFRIGTQRFLANNKLHIQYGSIASKSFVKTKKKDHCASVRFYCSLFLGIVSGLHKVCGSGRFQFSPISSLESSICTCTNPIWLHSKFCNSGWYWESSNALIHHYSRHQCSLLLSSYKLPHNHWSITFLRQAVVFLFLT